MERAYEGEHAAMSFDDYVRALGLPTAGSMRISLGIASNFLDVYRFLRFVDSFIDDRPVAGDLPPRSHC